MDLSRELNGQREYKKCGGKERDDSTRFKGTFFGQSGKLRFVSLLLERSNPKGVAHFLCNFTVRHRYSENLENLSHGKLYSEFAAKNRRNIDGVWRCRIETVRTFEDMYQERGLYGHLVGKNRPNFPNLTVS